MLTVTQYNVTARMGRPFGDAEVDGVFEDLARFHPALAYTDTAAEIILTVDDAPTAADALAIIEPVVTGGFGPAMQLLVETTADFDAATA